MKGLLLALMLATLMGGDATIAHERVLEDQRPSERIWRGKPAALHLRAGLPMPLPGLPWKLELTRAVWAPCPPDARCVVSGWQGAWLRLHGPDGRRQDIRAINMLGQKALTVRIDELRLCLRVLRIDPDANTALIEVAPDCPPPDSADDRRRTPHSVPPMAK